MSTSKRKLLICTRQLVDAWTKLDDEDIIKIIDHVGPPHDVARKLFSRTVCHDPWTHHLVSCMILTLPPLSHYILGYPSPPSTRSPATNSASTSSTATPLLPTLARAPTSASTTPHATTSPLTSPARATTSLLTSPARTTALSVTAPARATTASVSAPASSSAPPPARATPTLTASPQALLGTLHAPAPMASTTGPFQAVESNQLTRRIRLPFQPQPSIRHALGIDTPLRAALRGAGVAATCLNAEKSRHGSDRTGAAQGASWVVGGDFEDESPFGSAPNGSSGFI